MDPFSPTPLGRTIPPPCCRQLTRTTYCQLPTRRLTSHRASSKCALGGKRHQSIPHAPSPAAEPTGQRERVHAAPALLSRSGEGVLTTYTVCVCCVRVDLVVQSTGARVSVCASTARLSTAHKRRQHLLLIPP